MPDFERLTNRLYGIHGLVGQLVRRLALLKLSGRDHVEVEWVVEQLDQRHLFDGILNDGCVVEFCVADRRPGYILCDDHCRQVNERDDLKLDDYKDKRC